MTALAAQEKIADNFLPSTELTIDDVLDNIFAPTDKFAIDHLFDTYQATRSRLENMAKTVCDLDNEGLLHFFVNANVDGTSKHGVPNTQKLFNIEGAIRALNANYWDKTLKLTDVLQYMPNDRRTEWFESIRSMETPEFERGTVTVTLRDMLNRRENFFAEKVDGIFRKLSGKHVTNRPEGFSKRIIMNYIMQDQWFINSERCGYIDDLRSVINKFMGVTETFVSFYQICNRMREYTGTWHEFDGGLLRAKLYKKGTLHLEIHPDMVWRLNAILAKLYPLAIPPKFRRVENKNFKSPEKMEKPLSGTVLVALTEMRLTTNEQYRQKFNLPDSGYIFTLARDVGGDKLLKKEINTVIESIGGVPISKGNFYHFDYDASSVIDEIIITGRVPDDKSHQFYPTPEEVQDIAVSMASLDEDGDYIEPSAGNGNLAKRMPANTLCVEVAATRCSVLKARGFNVIEQDFLAFSATTNLRFDGALMNPPFTAGQAEAHVKAVSNLIKINGSITAVMPASFNGKIILEGWQHEYSEVIKNSFTGTAVSVVVVKMSRTSG